MGVFAWVTLATNDSYSLGALVLGHSLRRVGTPHDLVVLVTPGVSASMRDRLSSVFTLVQEVNLLDSRDEANLALLERPELGITFTKLHCWRLTQYEKCVFLDADTLVLKNSDELFEREELSAAPDPGWPDCFNSGVFVYRPSLDTFNALIKFALSKGSFDGGDQGLLNLFFSDWATKDISRHLPFIYNMVSTATYSYLPAYKAFGESAKIAHFIGSNKPWLQYFDSETRLVRPPQGSEHLQRLLQLWWDIFCSTVHPSLSPDMAQRSSNETRAHTAPQTVSHFTNDLFQRFQPMSVDSEYQPIPISPYIEDPGLAFWDPWEDSMELPDNTKYNNHSSHTTLWNYHGSEQQLRAFENDKRQSGWQRHTHDYQSTQKTVMSSHETFQTQSHHSQQNHQKTLLHHQSYQHNHPELPHHNVPHHQTEMHHHEQHYHHEPHHQTEIHHHESHHQTEMHHHKPHYHLGPHHQTEMHHQKPHDHLETHHQTETHHHEPYYHHESHHKTEVHHHEPHYHHAAHHQTELYHDPPNQTELQHYEPYYHHEPHHETEIHHHEPHYHHEPHNQTELQHNEPHYHHEPHHYELQHHQEQLNHNQRDHNHHELHQHHHHQESPSQQQQHRNDQYSHEHNAQHHTKPHTQETYHRYNVPTPQREGQNQQKRLGEHTDKGPHPDAPPPASLSSSATNNNKYVKISHELECLVAQPALTGGSSKAADHDLGLAGALAQMTLGVPRSAEQTAFEEHMRKQAWEQGNMDYMGRDSFDNIWRKITETLAEAPPKPETQKAATGEVPTIKPIPEPIPLLSELAEPKSTTLPSTGADETPGITSSATKPTEPTLLMTQDSEPSLPKSAAPSVPSVPPEGPTPSPSPGDQVKVEQTVPHTPLVTEATPPTSPPVTASTADNRALTVDVSPLETPPLGSTPEKPLSDTQIPAPATQTVQVSESPVQAEAVYVSEQETKSTESKELPVPTQGIPSAIPAETKPTEDLSASQETLPAQKSPVSQPSPTQENPPASVALSSPVPSSLQEVPVIPSIPQVPLTQESLSAVSAPLASIPEPSQVPEVPVTSSNAQAPPAQESASASIPEPSPTPEVPVTPTLVHVPLTQESSSGSLPLASTPEPSPVSEVPATLSVAQVPPIQESSSVPVPPVSTPEQSPVASPIPQQPPPIQEVPADLTVPQQAASTEEALATPVTKHVEQKEPSSVQQHLPPTPPASPDSVETKPVLASPSTQAPVSSEKTEVKQREQKGSPPADKTESHSESAAEDIHQKPTAPVQASTTIDKTKPTLSETSPVIEKQDPEPTPTADQKVGPPVPPSPGLLPSAPAETAPTAAPPPSKPAPAEPPSPAPSSKSKEPPKTPTPAKAEGPAPTAPSKTQSSPVQDAPKKATEAKSSTGEKEGSAPSAQSKPEESPKSVPSKPSVSESPPSTPEASPSDQAPVPPKRRGHKGVGTAPPDQGAASKPAAQSPQSKGPKPGQKSKK